VEGKVSVIIPTYNRPKWLPEAIDSVLNQTYHDIEIIVVNDGSTDDTEKVLEPYMDKIRYIYKENGGPSPSSAVNAGIAAAKGEYIARLDDDDLFLPEKTELQVKMFEENPDLGLVTSHHYVIDADGKILYLKEVEDFPEHGIFYRMLQYCLFAQPTVMVRKECYDRVGLYRYILAEDYDMWLRISRFYPAGVVNKPLAMYRRHGSNISRGPVNSEVKFDIDIFICEYMDLLSLEDLLPGVKSVPHAYDIRGGAFMAHNLYKQAGREFYTALKLDPRDAIHYLWLGILLRQMEHYEKAHECLKKIPPGHDLYENALKAINLISKIQSIDREDERVLDQLRKEVIEEQNGLMDITVDLAMGGSGYLS
jgi:glycosyltransferase involved in cell wall biosynthesis